MYIKEICNKTIMAGLIIFAASITSSVSGQAIGLVIAALAWILRMVVERRLEFKGIPLNFPILAITAAFVISAVVSTYPFYSLDRLDVMLRIIIYYVIINGIKDIKQVDRLVLILFVIAVVEGILGCSQYFLDTYPRPRGTLGGPHAFAGCLEVVFPIIFSYAFFGNASYQQKIILFIGTLIIFLAIIFSSTRGAWIGIYAAVIVMAILRDKRLLFVVLIATILVPLMFPEKIINRAKTIFIVSSDVGNVSRVYQWKGALEIIKDYPLLGTGPNTFQVFYFQKYIQPDMPEREGTYCHNIFLNTAAEQGLLGIAALLWLLTAGFLIGLKTFKATRDAKQINVLSLGLLGSLVTIVVHGMVDCLLLHEHGYLLWFVLGIMVVVQRESLKEHVD
ncbi:MAG: O-antigen ligase family protein [bacterium]|nr:O-antigen ligase family protein [bacterium]